MGAYDPETVNVLRDALNQAWALLPNERKAVTLKADMADRILKCAAEGERDPVRLRMAELLQRAAGPSQSESNAHRGGAK
jgi:hypothetical protein